MEKAGPEDVCAGCKKAFRGPRAHWGARADLYPKVSVYTCWGRGRYPSPKCVMLARANLALCPGCQAPDTTIGTICDGCQNKLKRGNTLEARKMEWWGIAADALGPYLSEHVGGDWKRPLYDLAELLCKAVAAGRTVDQRDNTSPGSWGAYQDKIVGLVPSRFKAVDYTRASILYVELMEGQGQVLEELCLKIRDVMRAEWKKGFDQGSNILRRLASGEKGLLESEADIERTLENYRQGEERRPEEDDE